MFIGTWRSGVFRGLAALLVSVAALTGSAGQPLDATPAAATRAASGPAQQRPDGPIVRHHRTQPAFSYASAIRQSVWVLTRDFDHDGARDRVAVDIIRPRELARSAKVPVIVDASPYYACCGRGNESELKTYGPGGRPLKFPLFYDNYFVPRGYAVAEVDMAGTNRSTGCSDQGYRSDVYSVKAVVDWLNGRGRAVDASGDRVKAGWTNGRVGMIGKSYDGTLANAVAATGVEGLETVVPISAISSWYNYDRYQGLPFSYDYPTYLSSVIADGRTTDVDCSKTLARMAANDGDESGRYTAFWSHRDYRATPRPDASRVRASVFLVHGLQDTNVQTPNLGLWWRELRREHVRTKLWLSRLGHTDPFDFRRKSWVATLHRWFDTELYGLRNGISKQPKVSVETRPGHLEVSDQWPMSTQRVELRPKRSGRLGTGQPGTGQQAFVNATNQSEVDAVLPGRNRHRLLFVTGALDRGVRISGAPVVRLATAHASTRGQLGIALVDYGTHVRVPDDGMGNRTLRRQSCWGQSAEFDDACYHISRERRVRTPLAVIARGWARLRGSGVERVRIRLTDNDVRVPAGDRLGLVVFAASPDWVVTVDDQSTRYRVRLGSSFVSLPVVGAMPGFGRADPLARRAASAVPTGTLPDPNVARRLPR